MGHRKHTNNHIKRSLVAAGTAALLLMSGGVGFAISDSNTPTRDEALAALDHAQQDINTARAYIESVPETPPTTDPPQQGEITATASVVDTKRAKIDWQTDRTDITKWHVERDGQDTNGYGTWGTDLPAAERSFTFDLLRQGDTYTFTLTPHTAAGALDPVTATVTMGAPPTDPTDPPTDPSGDTAAEVHGWGTPIAQGSDEFNYVGAPAPSKWGVYNSAGHDGNGRRTPERVTVDGDKLVMTGLANGDSAGMASTFNQQYGRWEARIRSHGEGQGHPYHPLLIIWPESNQWPDHGEYDFFENTEPGAQYIQAFLHHPNHQPYRQEHAKKDGVDTSQWQNIGFEWTPDHLKGFLNGEEWFHFDKHNITGMPSGHLTIQLDNFHGAGMQPATYEVDWTRTYALD